MHVAYDTHVGDVEDRSEFILVHGDDEVRLLHTGQVLDRTRDTHGEVEIRTNRFTGLSDLSLVCENTCIDHRTRSRYFGTEHVGKLAQGLEPFCRADTAAARNEYFGFRNVDHILLFLDRFQNPYAEL